MRVKINYPNGRYTIHSLNDPEQIFYLGSKFDYTTWVYVESFDINFERGSYFEVAEISDDKTEVWLDLILSKA